MENKIIYSKTARGVREAASKTKEVSRELRKVLKAVDGKSNFQALLAALDGYTEKTLQQAVADLIKNGYIRDPDEYSVPSAPPITSPRLPVLVSHDDDEFDFTSMADIPSEPTVMVIEEAEAQIKAKVRAKQGDEAALARRKAEEAQAAEEKIRLEAKRKIKENLRRKAEALAQRKAEAECLQREAEAKAAEEAAERLRRQAWEKSKQEVETLAQRKIEEERICKEIEEQIRLDVKREVEERRQREAEVRAK